MGRSPENPYLVAMRNFPARLEQAKKLYELEELGGKDLDWNELAPMIGVTKSVMSEIKLGKRAPRLVEVVKLSAKLGVRPEWLAFGSGLMADRDRQATVVAPIVTRRGDGGEGNRRVQ